jgi:hypothetical protein
MKVSLYSFATFVAGGPSAKLSAVASAKHPTAYDPVTDWWKQLREFLRKNHQNGGSQKDLIKFATGVTQKKQAGYAHRVKNYNAWWAKNVIASAPGQALVWSASGVSVSVNPELFLLVNGQRHVIKLYFKQSEKLSADRANVVLRLLDLKYGKSQTVVGLLDLAQGTFLTPSTSLAYLDPLLAGEAASFAAIWPAV